MTFKQSVKLLVGDVADFIKEDWNPWAYGYTLFVAAILVVAFYPLNGYERLIMPMYYQHSAWLGIPLFWMAVYFSVAIPNLLIRKEYQKLKNPRFYLKAAAFIMLMGYSIGYQWYRQITYNPNLLYEDSRFLSWCWVYADGIFLVVAVLAIYKYLFDKDIAGIYGLCRKTRHVNVYLAALLFILPFVMAASFLPDFQSYYPRFNPNWFENAFSLPQWAQTIIFEVCYGSDFITTEVFFRGAMVIGMAAILGPRAVLPMCAMYCAVHFGKPMLESCSALFGGYLLGILAYKTKHIWGGVCAHLGIAMMMEIMGLIHLMAQVH